MSTPPSFEGDSHHHPQHSMTSPATLSLSVDDPLVAISILSVNNDSHPQPFDKWQRQIPPCPAFRNNHDIQPRHIGASMRQYALFIISLLQLFPIIFSPASPNESMTITRTLSPLCCPAHSHSCARLRAPLTVPFFSVIPLLDICSVRAQDSDKKNGFGVSPWMARFFLTTLIHPHGSRDCPFMCCQVHTGHLGISTLILFPVPAPVSPNDAMTVTSSPGLT